MKKIYTYLLFSTFLCVAASYACEKDEGDLGVLTTSGGNFNVPFLNSIPGIRESRGPTEHIMFDTTGMTIDVLDDLARRAFILNKFHRLNEVCDIEILVSVLTQDFSIMTEHATSLFTEGMDRFNKGRIIEALKTIPPENISTVIEHACALFTDDMYGFEKGRIIEALGTISPETIPAVMKHAGALFIKGMDGSDKVDIIEALASVPVKDIENKAAEILARRQ